MAIKIFLIFSILLNFLFLWIINNKLNLLLNKSNTAFYNVNYIPSPPQIIPNKGFLLLEENQTLSALAIEYALSIETLIQLNPEYTPFEILPKNTKIFLK